MDPPKIFESEYRFCLILWEHEPIKSSELVKLCGEELGWKPTTVYTVIKRLSERRGRRGGDRRACREEIRRIAPGVHRRFHQGATAEPRAD